MGLLDRVFGPKAPAVAPIHLETTEELDAMLDDGGKAVIVYVWGHGCAPCNRMSSVIVEIATRHAERIRIAEVSRETGAELIGALEVRATPTVIVFRQGEEIGRVSGYRPASWFDEMIAAEL